jgi:uncharacterized protein YkwD
MGRPGDQEDLMSVRAFLVRQPLAANLVLVLVAAFPAFARAQVPAPEPKSGPELLQRLRAADLTLDEAAVLVPQLVVQPVALRLAASDALRNHYLELLKAHGRACQQLQRDVAKVVAARLKAGAGKREAEAVDAARRAALQVSRRNDLTKELIHSDIDPLVTQLEAALWPTSETLRAAEPALTAGHTQLVCEREQLARARALYVEAGSELALDPDASKHFVKVPPPSPPPTPAALADEWLVWTLLAMPLSARDRKALEGNEALRATSDPEEFAGTTALNRLRFLLGLPLLRIDDRLGKAARDHANDMVTHGFFDHTSPLPGKKTPGDRAARFQTSGGAENIAQGHDTGPSAIRGWWYSPGHHRNMLGDHGRTGLGRCEQTWTQMFGG